MIMGLYSSDLVPSPPPLCGMGDIYMIVCIYIYLNMNIYVYIYRNSIM